MSMRSGACKNDNSAYVEFLIRSPDAYFTSFQACIAETIWNILLILCRLTQHVKAECYMRE